MDKFFAVYVGLIGVAIAVIISNSFLSTQNQQFIKNSIDTQTGDIKKLQVGQDNATDQRAEFYKSILGNLTTAVDDNEHEIIKNRENATLRFHILNDKLNEILNR